MLLTDVKAYLMRRRRAAASELTAHFGVEASALTGILEHWIRKGALRRLTLAPRGTCGGCTACAPAADAVYEWIGAPPETAAGSEGALVTDRRRC